MQSACTSKASSAKGNVHFRLEWLLSNLSRCYEMDVIELGVLDLLHNALTNLTPVCQPEYEDF